MRGILIESKNHFWKKNLHKALSVEIIHRNQCKTATWVGQIQISGQDLILIICCIFWKGTSFYFKKQSFYFDIWCQISLVACFINLEKNSEFSHFLKKFSYICHYLAISLIQMSKVCCNAVNQKENCAFSHRFLLFMQKMVKNDVIGTCPHKNRTCHTLKQTPQVHVL